MGSINYPTSPDWSNGRFYGPTSQQTTDFPNNVYLNPTEWHLWQLEAQLANTISASNSYASIATSLGLNVANPFTPSIAIIQQQITQFRSILNDSSTTETTTAK